MRSFPNFLNKIIAEDLHFNPVNRSAFRLIEKKENLSVEIRFNDSDNIFCFSIDKDRDRTKSKADPIFPFFNTEEEGICSKNDFILVCQKQDKVFVLLIELKSKEIKGYLKQLRSGKVLFQFILDKVRIYNHDFTEHSFQYKGILFRKNRETPDKGTTRKSKKLHFDLKQDLEVTCQSYDNVYYLSQFL